MQAKRLLLAGVFNNNSLESSYSLTAEKELGFEVLNFDLAEGVNKYVKGGKIGKTLHRFFPVEAWIIKMNRDIIINAIKFKPDIFIYFTTGNVSYGTIATLKSINPHLKIVWIWPDTPLNLLQHNFVSAQLADLTATYSYATVDVFKQLGLKNVQWIPLAGDSLIHKKEISNGNLKRNISFVGRWSIERANLMLTISNNFPNLNIEIHGPLWKKKVTDHGLKKNIKGEGFYGEELASFFNSSQININIIDDTNYPAANMRFFEIPTAGGLQITSSCPEMENEFVHKQHLLYYKNDNELLENIQWVLDNPEESDLIKTRGQQLLMSKHTYSHRLEKILKNI